ISSRYSAGSARVSGTLMGRRLRNDDRTRTIGATRAERKMLEHAGRADITPAHGTWRRKPMNTIVAHDSASRLSWGAILAGVSLSLAVYLLLGVLGTAVTGTVADPLASGSGAGTGPYTG